MKSLYVLLVACALTTAMEPSTDNPSGSVANKDNTPEYGPEDLCKNSEIPTDICAHQTPCRWGLYEYDSKIIVYNINNTDCSCGPGTACVQDEEDDIASCYIYRCR